MPSNQSNVQYFVVLCVYVLFVEFWNSLATFGAILLKYELNITAVCICYVILLINYIIQEFSLCVFFRIVEDITGENMVYYNNYDANVYRNYVFVKGSLYELVFKIRSSLLNSRYYLKNTHSTIYTCITIKHVIVYISDTYTVTPTKGYTSAYKGFLLTGQLFDRLFLKYIMII